MFKRGSHGSFRDSRDEFDDEHGNTESNTEDSSLRFVGDPRDKPFRTARWSHQKLAHLIGYVEEHCDIGDPQSMLRTIESFARGIGQWLKVAGGAKARLIESALAGWSLVEGKLLVEFGTYVGFSSVRFAEHVRRGSCASLSRRPRFLSIEVDVVNAAVARHLIDLAMLHTYMEVWTGQIRDVIPRLVEVFGERCLAFGFMDYKGSRYHVDVARWEALNLVAPSGRFVADNTISPGAPLLLWNLSHTAAWAGTYWALEEFLEDTIEDWMAVFDFVSPTR